MLCPETGLLCHLDDACISNPCHRGALCDTNPLNGQYICTCPQGYKGADCTEDVDECAMGEWLASFLGFEVVSAQQVFQWECVVLSELLHPNLEFFYPPGSHTINLSCISHSGN